MRCILFKSFLILLSGLFSSCIYEDLSACYKEIVFNYDLSVEATNGTVTEEMFINDVKDLSVFVFDCNGLYIGTWYFNADKIKTANKVPLNLPPGTYSMVMWGGLINNEYNVGVKSEVSEINPLVVGKSKIEDFILKVLVSQNQNIVNAKYENLYHSVLKNVKIEEKVNAKITLPIKKISNDITVQLRGMPKRSVSSYSTYNYIDVFIEADNGMYDYNGLVSDNATKLIYTPYERIENLATDFLEVKMRMMDIFSTKSPQLVIKNAQLGTEMYRYDLKKLIQQIENPWSQIEYKIEIFYNTHGSVIIHVNTWIVEYIIVEH